MSIPHYQADGCKSCAALVRRRDEVEVERMRITGLVAILLAPFALMVSPAGAQVKHPGTDAGARALLADFVKPGADVAQLSQQFRATDADYAAVFSEPIAKKVAQMYDGPWKKGQFVIGPKPGQTEVVLNRTTSDEIRVWSPAAKELLPGGWKKLGTDLKPGLTIYVFRFSKPGETTGTSVDGLVHVNGAWRLFPQCWRARDIPD